MTAAGVPTCAYRVDAALVELLDERLGPPLDSYVRGWQVWLLPNGPGPDAMAPDANTQEVLEWRLHPPARFRMPRGVDPHDLFDVVLQGLAGAQGDERAGAVELVPLEMGRERHVLGEVWEVLEVFPAYTGDVAVRELVAAVTRALGGRAPDVAGLADHDRLGDLYKGSRGDFSVGRALLEALEPLPPTQER